MLDATTDADRIVAWWERYPGANVGGACTGKLIIDIDSYKPGAEPPAGLPPTREHSAKGRHLVYTAPDEPRRKALSTGVDVQSGPSRYVVLPPSVHPSGKRYLVRDWSAPAEAPGWLCDLARKVPESAEALPDLPEPEPIRALTRAEQHAIHNQDADPSNHTFYVACAAVRSGRSDGQIVTVLESDETTVERWGARSHLRDLELRTMLPRARAKAAAERLPDKRPKTPEEPVPDGPDDDADEPAYPCLPDTFWEARPELAHIRRAAQARMVAPDATFCAVLARVSALTHFCHQLPPIVARTGTLDLEVAVVAIPGFGKGGSMDAAEELVPGCNEEDGNRVRTMALGSGEGMAAAYFGKEQEEGDDGKLHWVTRRTFNAVLFNCDEGSAYKALAERSGQTTGEFIRQAFSGERQGGTYVGASKGTQLTKRSYRAALVMAFQPVHAQKLLGEWTEGTPLRFLWTTARDPNMLDEPPWPGVLRWKPSAIDQALDPAHSHGSLPIKVTRSTVREIRQRHAGKHRGEWDPGRYDAHRDLLRLKVAALLGSLRTGTPVVSRDDWHLAGIVLDTSDLVRTRILDDIGAQQEQILAGRIDFARRRAGAEAEGRLGTEHEIVRCAGVLVRKAAKFEEGVTRKQLRESLASYDKTAWFEPALKHAEANDLLRQSDDGKRWHAT